MKMMNPEAIIGKRDRSVRGICCAIILVTRMAQTPNHNSPIITNLRITDTLIR